MTVVTLEGSLGSGGSTVKATHRGPDIKALKTDFKYLEKKMM